jgi:hypothetical protein
MFKPVWIVMTVGLGILAFSAQGCGPTRYLVDLNDCDNVTQVEGMKVGKCAVVKVKK